MPTSRRRSETEFEVTPTQSGTQTLTLQSLTGGFNDYTNPELMSPQFWAAASNVYSGQHGTIRRARWAPVANAASLGAWANGSLITSLFGFMPVGVVFPFLIFENANAANTNMFPIDIIQYGGTSGTIIPSSPTIPRADLYGPYMRFASTPALILQTNGAARSKIFYFEVTFLGTAFNFEWEFWGIDAPDSSPAITLTNGTSATINSAGANRTSNIASLTASATLPANFIIGNWVEVTLSGDTSFNTIAGQSFQITAISTVSNPNDTFSYSNVGPDVASASTGGAATVQITKSVGRSYQFAWENSSTGHVSAPSPASQYIPYNNQTGIVIAEQPGTIQTTMGSPSVIGTNTYFTSAWIGRTIYTDLDPFVTDGKYIVSVTDATHLTMSGNALISASNQGFQVVDFQTDFIRFYATGDGGATYLRIARNQLNGGAGAFDQSFSYTDTDDSEPPNGSFTNELAQNNNVPPPIGSFLQDYQGRILVFGVTGALQSFFYSNIETTVVGQPPESFAPLNEVTLPVGESQLNGMANLPTGCVIWSSKQDMFKLTGTLTDNTIANAQQLGATIQRLPYRIGCASPYATSVTNLGAFWMSSDREIWLFTDHYAPKNIGKPIQNLLNQATRIGFAKMKNYKSGDRNWLALAITVGDGDFNNTLCLLDLDLLASNGQPSFFTFDMATNQPSWYIYNVNCESIEAAFDAFSTNHLLAGDVDLITDLDWNDGYYTVDAEQSIPNSLVTLHAIGNQDPEVIKTGRWMRVTTNALPKNLSSQGWNWNILCFDDDKYVLGINPQIVQLIPGVNSPNQVFALEYSPSVFRFGGYKPVKGRRFQIQTNFPSGPGFYELRGFQVSYDQIVAR